MGGAVGSGGIRVYVNEELKFLSKFTKKCRSGGGCQERGSGGGWSG